MIFLSILILIVAIALPSINKNISSVLYLRISSIVFIYAGALSLNAFYIQSIGSGIGIYSGLFHVTVVSQLIDTFLPIESQLGKLFFLNIIFYILILVLSLLLIHISKKGFLGLIAKNFCQTKYFFENIILLFLILSIITLVFNLFFTIIQFLNIKPDFLYVNENTATPDQDPVIWWPSGTPQSWSIIGSAVAVYRLVPGSTRVKATAALTTLGITAPTTIWFHAVENPNGFNKLMFGIMEYKRTGIWPTNIPNKVNDNQLNPIFDKMSEEANITYSNITSSSSSSTNTSLVSDVNLLPDLSIDSIIKFFLELFRPTQVHGHLDDLIGQQIFVYFLLLVIVISLIILFFIYLVINIMLHNKNFILNKFNNKFIKYYINYQQLLGKISIFILPLIIMFGLIEIAVGLHFLITHPIPWEELPIDLHTYIKKK